jgi:hypothetical protein
LLPPIANIAISRAKITHKVNQIVRDSPVSADDFVAVLVNHLGW